MLGFISPVSAIRGSLQRPRHCERKRSNLRPYSTKDCHVANAPRNDSIFQRKRYNTSGFTLLELLIVIAILTISLGIGVPAIGGWSDSRDFDNSYKFLAMQLREAREQAQVENTTVRLSAASTMNPGEYVLTRWVASTPVANCDAAGTWMQDASVTFTVDEAAQLTAGSLGENCFYRDGTAFGLGYELQHTANSYSAVITPVLATGYIDVVVTK